MTRDRWYNTAKHSKVVLVALLAARPMLLVCSKFPLSIPPYAVFFSPTNDQYDSPCPLPLPLRVVGAVREKMGGRRVAKIAVLR
eukprot:9318439-Pyramimonas_sp.AAC.1